MSLQTLFKIGKIAGKGLVGSFFGKEKASPAQVIQLSEEERKKRAISFLGAEEYGYPYPGDDAPNILIPEPLVQTQTSFIPSATVVPEVIDAPRGQIVRGLGGIILEIERINRNIANIQKALADKATIESKYREEVAKGKQEEIAQRDKLRSQRRANRRREALFRRTGSAVMGALDINPQQLGGSLLTSGILASIFSVMEFSEKLTGELDKFINGIREKLGLPVEEKAGPLGPITGLPALPPTNTIPGQQYGDPRDDDGDGKPDRKHAGVDFDIRGNEEFFSRIGGLVTKVGTAQGYGNYVDIYNAKYDVTERIAEGARVLPGIEEGVTVQPGQAVVQGESETGVIHYEIRQGKKTTFGFAGTKDPLEFLKSITPKEPPPTPVKPVKKPEPKPQEQASAPIEPPASTDIAYEPVMPVSSRSGTPSVLDLGPVARAPIVIDARKAQQIAENQQPGAFATQKDIVPLEPRLLNSGHEAMFA